MSTYPDRCVIRVERRTVPGESPEQALAQIQLAVAAVAARVPNFRAEVTLENSRPPSDLAVDHPLVTTLVAATTATGETARVDGVSYWSDAALFNEAGMPTLCYGPGDIALAHGAVEWIPTAEITRVTDALTHFLGAWTRP
jgi:acetylornithine deacetylase